MKKILFATVCATTLILGSISAKAENVIPYFSKTQVNYDTRSVDIVDLTKDLDLTQTQKDELNKIYNDNKAKSMSIGNEFEAIEAKYKELEQKEFAEIEKIDIKRKLDVNTERTKLEQVFAGKQELSEEDVKKIEEVEAKVTEIEEAAMKEIEVFIKKLDALKEAKTKELDKVSVKGDNLTKEEENAYNAVLTPEQKAKLEEAKAQ